MRQFLVKFLIFITLLAGTLTIVFMRADGYLDPFYIRFTSPKQSNLILGTSRSAQGLQPKVFEKIINKKIFNYSFTILHSPYGPVYLESIKRKLNPKTKDGIFIVTVDPWAITSRCKDPDDVSKFRENNTILDKVKIVNIKPNFEYLAKFTDGKYYQVLKKRSNGKVFLNDDGWLGVNISMDSAVVKKRLVNKVEHYKQSLFPKHKFSTVRVDYLKKTIEYLKQYGKVYIVRLPVSSEIFEIEEQLMPNFDVVIGESISIADGYFDMSPENHLYQYTDGNHLWSESGAVVSEKVAKWIKSLQ